MLFSNFFRKFLFVFLFDSYLNHDLLIFIPFGLILFFLLLGFSLNEKIVVIIFIQGDSKKELF